MSKVTFDYAKAGTRFPTAAVCRDILKHFGWEISFEYFDPERPLPTLTIHRSNGAFYFNGFVPDCNISMKITTPYGAPVLTGCDGIIADNSFTCHPPVTIHNECRCFVKQSEENAVCMRTRCQEYMEYTRWDRRCIKGLVNAEVRYFPPADFNGTFEFQVHPDVIGPNKLLSIPLLDYEWENTPDGPCIVIRNVTGVFYISLVK